MGAAGTRIAQPRESRMPVVDVLHALARFLITASLA